MYFKDKNNRIHKIEANEYNTVSQILLYNPDLIEEVTEAEWEAQVLPYRKERKCKLINRKTDEIILGGFDHNGIHFDCKPEDQRNLTFLMLKIQAGADLTGQFWRASNESYEFINNADVLEIMLKGENLILNAVESGAILKDAINACETIAEIDEIEDNR